MLVAGCEAKHTTFIMTDTQIMYESFLEDVNNILNTGEITNLYSKEDTETMAEYLEPILTKRKIAVTKDTIYSNYIERLRDHYHIILCMSPVGDKLRDRTRMFPSLVNCCTLDWFSSWPEEALLSVATQYLQRIEPGGVSSGGAGGNISDSSQQKALAELFPLTHKSVETAADKFYN